MSRVLTLADLSLLAPAGYHLGLRVGFSFAAVTENTFPKDWVELYTQEAFFLDDPVVRWAHSRTGTTTWAELSDNDPRGVLRLAATFGLKYGYAVSIMDADGSGQRSYGMFAREDRDFAPMESRLLTHYVTRRHRELAPPGNITARETEVLARVSQGQRLKVIAYELGLSEGAIKQRLKLAKTKLGAKTTTEATAMARARGLI